MLLSVLVGSNSLLAVSRVNTTHALAVNYKEDDSLCTNLQNLLKHRVLFKSILKDTEYLRSQVSDKPRLELQVSCSAW